jgi:hypothetical protein
MSVPKIEPCPPAGSGVNDWLYISAIKLARVILPDEIEAVLAHGAANCGRTVSANEIRRAVKRGVEWVLNSPADWKSSQPFVRSFSSELRYIPCDRATLERILAEEPFDLDKLTWESPASSPSVLESDKMMPLLFPGNPWICCGWDNSRFECRPLNFWTGRWSHELTPPRRHASNVLVHAGRRHRARICRRISRLFMVAGKLHPQWPTSRGTCCTGEMVVHAGRSGRRRNALSR